MRKPVEASESAEEQLASFIAKYTPETGSSARAILAKMRKRLPGAFELVYDNYNALVIGFGPTERPSEAVFSIVLYPSYVTLCFVNGVRLKDPKKLLMGGGNQVRHIRLKDASHLDNSAVRDLISQAIRLSPKPFDKKSPARLVIRSISAKQRPRRPAQKPSQNRGARRSRSPERNAGARPRVG
jgi:hypothetical protein